MGYSSKGKMNLALDYDCVMSAWEKIGGNIFSCDDVKLDSIADIHLDLSSFEASLYPTSRVDTSFNYFSSVGNLFTPAELGLNLFHCIKAEPCSSSQQKVTGTSALQVVPGSCFSNVFSGSDSDAAMSEAKDVETKQEPVCFPELGPMPSISSSSDAAVVPDVSSTPSQAGSTASSSSPFGIVPQAFSCPPQRVPVPSVPHTIPHVPAAVPKNSAGDDMVRTRQECLERYREKKARRLYTKKIRYQLRKINADKRPRIKGRFVKKEELDEFLKQRSGPAQEDEEVVQPFCFDSDLEC